MQVPGSQGAIRQRYNPLESADADPMAELLSQASSDEDFSGALKYRGCHILAEYFVTYKRRQGAVHPGQGLGLGWPSQLSSLSSE